ncbi:MAG: Uma2 family endonuclease [Acidobacteria bacterium]|nr:Uma2 family endonuclease [Acidobacteriota bacterium]
MSPRDGVAHLWMLDPVARTLEVLRLEQGHWTILATHTGAETVRAEPFEALEIDLRLLWDEDSSA